MKIKKSIVAIGAAVLLLGSTIAFSEPGSDNDPLISLSYLNNSIEQIKVYIDSKIGNINNNGTNSSNDLEIVEINKGQFLIGYSGTEIILRSGKGKAVVSDLGGLSDVTAGNDIGKDMNIPSNHLLIIPRSDGRGVYATSDAIFMVRGIYDIR